MAVKKVIEKEIPCVQKEVTTDALNRVENNLSAFFRSLEEEVKADIIRIDNKLDQVENNLIEMNGTIKGHVSSDAETKKMMEIETQNSKDILKLVIDQSEKSRLDSKELLNSFMSSQNKQFKILITILAGVAGLVTALSAFLGK